MANNPEQQRLQALLRFAASAGSHGNEPIPEGHTVNVADRTWLNEALNQYSADAINPIDYLKVKLRLIYHYLKKDEEKEADKFESEQNTELEDVIEALQGISDNCDQFDLAMDLHKIGGYDVLLQCLHHEESSICWNACEVIATVAQNHEYCQEALVEMNALPVILYLVDSNTNDKVREKAFYALSCIVRGNERALKHMDENDGYSVLIRAMQSDNAKLCVKSIFFVRWLCESDAKYTEILHQRGIDEQLVGMLKSFNDDLGEDSDLLNIIENALGCLFTMISTNENSKVECTSSSFELSSTLRQLRSKFVAAGNAYEECVKFCDLITESCFSDGDATAMDR